jgi:hypothetical protein
MKRFGGIQWLAGMGVMLGFALASGSHATTMELREGPLRAAGLIAARSLPQGSAPSEEKAYRYQYFPDAQVYFDPSRELYFYISNGEWTKSPALPRELRNRLGDFVVIETDDEDPYRYYKEAMKLVPNRLIHEEGRSRLWRARSSLSYQYHYYPGNRCTSIRRTVPISICTGVVGKDHQPFQNRLPSLWVTM